MAHMKSANMGQGDCYIRSGLEEEYAIKELANCHIASASQWIIKDLW